MANPDPEITPEDVKAVRPDAIVATGRSDYPNQVNNVLGFPYIFRGALDVRATHHQRRDEDRRRRSARRAGARGCARRSRRRLSRRASGLWPRLHHSGAVRSAPDLPRVARGGGSGDRNPASRGARSKDLGRLSRSSCRRGSIRPRLCSRRITASVRAKPKRVVFAEGEEESVIRAAAAFQNSGLGKAILVGREDDDQARHPPAPASTTQRARNPRAAFGARSVALYRCALQAPAAARRALSRLRCAW